jgi:hypothetical protein
MPRAPTLCDVCGVSASRYRCPTCAACGYCSVACCSAHRASCVPPPAPGAASAAAAATGAADDDDGIDDELRARLPASALAALRSDERVMAALRSSRLRAALRSVDTAADRVAALEQAKMKEGEPLADFFDAVLVALGVAEPHAARDDGGGAARQLAAVAPALDAPPRGAVLFTG